MQHPSGLRGVEIRFLLSLPIGGVGLLEQIVRAIWSLQWGMDARRNLHHMLAELWAEHFRASLLD